MAEFKLGRLRFVWQGTWSTSTAYVKDDVVRYGGKTYVCLVGNTSSSTQAGFNTDIASGYWTQMSDGISWKGTWTVSSTYAINDIVKFGAKDYICTTGHVSSAVANSGFYSDLAASNWTLMTDGIQWVGTWTSGAFYKIGDIVKNGAKDYICLVGHTAGSVNGGFYTDLNVNNYWTLIFDGLTFYGLWAGNVFYRQGDLVKYGGMVYQCATAHTSDATLLESDINKWIVFVPGFDWKGTWNSNSTHYKINDVVKYGANEWICTTAHDSSTVFDTDKFALFVEGLQFENSWTGGTTYQQGDIVTYGGYAYVAKQNHSTSQTPSTATTYWALLTTGFNLRGVWSGSASPTYKVGDVVSYGSYVYVAKADNANTNPASDTASWTLITTGIAWKGLWTASTVYKLGDAITYASNSYIVVQAHTASTGNRPDNDLSGTYWNPLTQGAASNVTTTRGDLIYYSANGNARLPIGTDGQMLKVVGSDPVWSTVNQVGNVYYVAPTGTDNTAAGYGSSLDKPWKTIAYACAQVASGPANPSAQYLLLNNRSFMSAEVVNYLAYTYKASVVSTSGNAFLTSNTAGLAVNMPVTFTNISGTLNVNGTAVATTATTATQTYASQSLTVNSVSGTTITMSASITGVAVNQRITFATSFGSVVAGVIYYVYNVSGSTLQISTTAGATAALTIGIISGLTITASVAGAILVGSSSTLSSGQPVTFSGTAFGSLSNSTQYYVLDVLSSTLITVSTTNGGPVLAGVTAATGSLSVVASTTYYVRTITSNTSFTVATTSGGGATTVGGTGSATAKLAFNGSNIGSYVGNGVDSFIFDIGRGGTIETVIFAKYFYATTTTYILQVSPLITQFIAGLSYLSTLATTAVLANTAPASNYQTLNGVSANVSQTINGAYSAEAGMTTRVTSLLSIVTSGLTAGTINAVAIPQNPNATIYVKTGTYSEVLPISVPAFTALVGDELRTTVVQPYTFTATASSSTGTSLVLSSASGVVAGMAVTGNAYIPDGTYIISISSNTLTLSNATTGNVTGAVTVGYTMSNMFYMRNSTGARNMSVTGLSGALGTANGYGTKRPNAGAYFSLDPGTGVQDDTVWITSRSPYIQNVSLFGTACVGAKIDGSLHAGGNKSLTLNDFTNILSDGIAVWCTNLAKVEAVSVFSYYGYAGYLSELGGAIRATNGNSSYGTYGCVAEGGNPAELSITGTVNTRATQATVTNVLISGGAIQWLEYVNAGQTYSSASYNVVSSTGVGASVSGPNISTNGICEVRIVTAGANYQSAVNNAQTGTSTTLTLSAADAANTASYNGERIVLTDGTGAGQYGFIGYYNGGTKIAIVCKESFATLTATSCTASTFTISSTSTIPVGSPIVFQGTTFGGVNNFTVYYVISTNFTATTFSVSTTLSSTTPAALTPLASGGAMTVQLCGWDVAVSGTSVLTNLDFTSKYIIEPRVTFTDSTGSGALVRCKVLSGIITEFRVINPGSNYTSPTIVITDPNATSAATTTVRVASGVLGQPTWTSRGTGYKDAQAVITGDGYADVQPVGFYIYLNNLSALPVAGANLVFQGNTTYYTLVQTVSSSGTPGNYSAYIQVNPGFNVTNAPTNATATTATIQYSQVRLTGHDFLYVGSGNFGSTGYPNNFSTANRIQTNEAVGNGGGRVFFTSTDQDGNFRVGGLFTVQQATGVATLNANLFNLSGLNALQFAAGGASVTQFSTDGTFSANSDAIVPTQRAIKTFLASQLGAGGAILAVSSLTAGQVIINSNQITTQNANDLSITAQTGQRVQLNTNTNINVTATVVNGASLIINGTGTQNATPTNPTDIVPKKYVDRVLSLNTMWTNAW